MLTFAMRKRSRAAAHERVDRALEVFEVSCVEPVRPGDPDYALARARRRQAAAALPIREIEARLARLKKARV